MVPNGKNQQIYGGGIHHHLDIKDVIMVHMAKWAIKRAEVPYNLSLAIKESIENPRGLKQKKLLEVSS